MALEKYVAKSTQEAVTQRQNPRQRKRMTTGEAIGQSIMATPFGAAMQGIGLIGGVIDAAQSTGGFTTQPGPSMIGEPGSAGRAAAPSPASGSPVENPELNAHRRAFLEATNRRLNEISEQFNLFQTLEGEGLSPEARRAIDQMKEDATRQVGEINSQIERYLNGVEVFNDLSSIGREQVEGAIGNANTTVAANRAASERTVDTLVGQGTSAVAQSTAQASADVIAAMGPATTQEGYPNDLRVFGGTEGAQERPVAEQQATEDLRTLENLVASNIKDVGAYQQQINKATSDAAVSQLNLLGITDAKTRLQAQTALETNLRNSVYDLVQSRQSIQRELERGIAAIEEEDAARRTGNIDALGLNIDPTPQGIFVNTFIDNLDKTIERIAPGLTPLQAEGLANSAQLWAQIGPGDPKRIEAANEIAISLGISDPTRVLRALEQAESQAAITAQQASNWDSRDKFTPGSPALVYGLFNVALELGWDAGTAAEWANSASLHQLIKQQSGGRVGSQSGATLRGIGGLSEDVYSQLGINYAEIEGDVHEEMKALLLYVQGVYGDPRAALSQSLDEQQFGVLPGNVRPVTNVQTTQGTRF